MRNKEGKGTYSSLSRAHITLQNHQILTTTNQPHDQISTKLNINSMRASLAETNDRPQSNESSLQNLGPSATSSN